MTTTLAPLRPLQHMTLLPEHYTPTMDVLSRLKKIDQVQIIMQPHSRDTKKKDFAFMIEIEVQPHNNPKSRIPTNLTRKNDSSPLSTNDDESKVVLHLADRTMSDFITLRGNLHRAVRHGHAFSNESCAYCTKVTNFVISSTAQPSPAMLWFASEVKIQRDLTRFMRDVLYLALLSKPSANLSCAAQEHIPELVNRFLFGDERVSLAYPH